MKKSMTLQIATPCHEDWAQMTTIQKGKFCDSCTKEVVDFTHHTDEEIVRFLSKNKNLCGRFVPAQLGRELTLERKSGYRLASLVASLLVPFSLLASMNQQSTEKSVPKEFTSLGIGSMHNTSSLRQKGAKHADTLKTVTISGVITDTSGLPLPGVNIIVKGTKIGAITNINGEYSIEAEPKQTLVFSYVGYLSKEVAVSDISTELIFSLELDAQIMGEIMMGLVAPISKFEEGPTIKPFGNQIGDNLEVPARDVSDTEKAMKNHKKFMELKRSRVKAARKEKRAKKKDKK